MSATTKPGITGLEPLNTLSLQRVYHYTLKSGQEPICFAFYANV